MEIADQGDKVHLWTRAIAPVAYARSYQSRDENGRDKPGHDAETSEFDEDEFV
jgi:hypothetical protein